MDLLTKNFEEYISNNIIKNIHQNKYNSACEGISIIIKQLYDAIPQNKKISYGKVHTVKLLGEFLYVHFKDHKIPVYDTANQLFIHAKTPESKAVALNILSYFGVDEPVKVLPIFRQAASDEDWQVREITQMLFRKIIKKQPVIAKKFLLKLVKSSDPNVRRFVGETLRPVVENKWIYQQPEYSLSVLKYLFKENKTYPRTSVGNNLSDLSRHLPEKIYAIVEELVFNGDKHSYWIAYRACRNLVKKEPGRVMELLKTDHYKYKDRIHKKETGND